VRAMVDFLAEHLPAAAARGEAQCRARPLL